MAERSSACFVGEAKSPRAWDRLQNPAPEVNMADAIDETTVFFDISDAQLLDTDEDILTKLTEDELKEMNDVVTLLDGAKEDSLNDFENQNNLLRHKPIDDAELDRLAGKNNALSTTYQTRWSICVLKGKFTVISCKT